MMLAPAADWQQHFMQHLLKQFALCVIIKAEYFILMLKTCKGRRILPVHPQHMPSAFSTNTLYWHIVVFCRPVNLLSYLKMLSLHHGCLVFGCHVYIFYLVTYLLECDLYGFILTKLICNKQWCHSVFTSSWQTCFGLVPVPVLRWFLMIWVLAHLWWDKSGFNSGVSLQKMLTYTVLKMLRTVNAAQMKNIHEILLKTWSLWGCDIAGAHGFCLPSLCHWQKITDLLRHCCI